MLGDFAGNNAGQPRRDDEQAIGTGCTHLVKRCIEIGDVLYRVGGQLNAEQFSSAPRKSHFVIEMQRGWSQPVDATLYLTERWSVL